MKSTNTIDQHRFYFITSIAPAALLFFTNLVMLPPQSWAFSFNAGRNFSDKPTTSAFVSLETIKSVKGILFDVDGTLADSWKLGFDATQVVLQRNNIELITQELYHDCTRYCTPDRLARHVGYVPEDGLIFHQVGQRLGKEFDDLYVNLVSFEGSVADNFFKIEKMTLLSCF